MKSQIIKNSINVFLFIFSISCFSQSNIFNTSFANKTVDNQKSLKIFNAYQEKENINKIYRGLKINTDIFNSKDIFFTIENKKISAKLLKKNVRGKDDFTWFGKTNEGFGVFFYVKNGKVTSKFDVGNYSYTLIPLNKNNHMLIEFNDTNVGYCGNEFDLNSNEKLKKLSIIQSVFNDDECTLRILIATTPTSRIEIINR